MALLSANLIITTRKNKEIVDITDSLNDKIAKFERGEGLCAIFITHTTAALTTADLDPGTDQDMLDAFEKIIPKLKYRHPHNPSYVGDHIMSSMIGASVVIPFKNKKLLLGSWQKIVLIELNGPRDRIVVVNIS